jgi:anti-sigma regulatory factor (Ser/Thr protein kinase)
MSAATNSLIRKMSFFVKDIADITTLVSKLESGYFLKDASHVDTSIVKTILYELGTNIVKYANRGSISVERIDSNDQVTLEIIAMDLGPGIANINLALQDRFSTGGTLGLGLPGVQRMSDSFEIFSSKESGTIVKVQKQIQIKKIARQSYSKMAHEYHKGFSVTQSLHTDQLDIASFVRPSPGEVVSGDKASVISLPQGVLLCMTDVSGHGNKASELANEIENYLAEYASDNLESLITDTHHHFKDSRGAAMGLLYVDYASWSVRYCGVGNTRASLISVQNWHPISKEGIIGLRLPSINVQSATLSRGDVFVMWTDGLPELACRSFVAKSKSSSSIRIASDVVRSLGRPTDDAGCLILRRL